MRLPDRIQTTADACKRQRRIMKVIRIAAAVLVQLDGQILLVRKRGTTAFMQPGGKIDAGETPEACLIRELREELELDVNPALLEPLGSFQAEAANEPDHLVDAVVFVVRSSLTEVFPAAEIEDVRWVSPSDPGSIQMAPLTEHHILPAFMRMT